MTQIASLSDETRDELASLALKLSGNPKTRKGFLGLVKQDSPNTPIPEIDEVAAVNAEIAKRDERISSLEKSFNDYKFGGELAAKKRDVGERYGFSEEDMKKMEERMGKKELPADYEWAARLHKQELESATPTNYGTAGFGPYDLKKNAAAMEGLMDDDNWAVRTAHDLIDDMQRQGKAKAF